MIHETETLPQINTITWTFPATGIDPRIAGKTFSGGVPAEINGIKVVDFGICGGIRIAAKIEGRVDLVAAVAAYESAQRKYAACAVAAYEPAQRKYAACYECGSANSACRVETLDCGCKAHRLSTYIDGKYMRSAGRDWTKPCMSHDITEAKGAGWCRQCESYCYGDCQASHG